ncbi:MAG: type VI secretion system accessory protein TagJ [Vicinamibacterales bacterium]
MTGLDLAAGLLKDGDPEAALARLQDIVRAHPDDAKHRVFLFQLLCVLGRWERALTQLKVASSLDPAALVMAQVYGDAVRCEAMRRAVFEGRKAPVLFGEPEPWLACLVESLAERHRGGNDRASQLRAEAFEAAPASAGTINDQPFEWIADADSRLGPVLEVFINGRYYWLPFTRLRRLSLDPPEDLRDLVWMPARLEFDNGGEAVALIPSRYPGSDSAGDGLIALSRKTTWTEVSGNEVHGLGQRVLTTDAADVPFLDVRTVVIEPAGAEASGTSQA